MKKRQKVLVIVGPTASGKSALAVALAKKFDGEVISADSRQVYRGLNIGTGKITKREMRGVPHHLLDVASPKRAFSAHNFATRSKRVIKKLAAQRKLPIVAGGTGFYIDVLFGRLTFPDVPPNKAFRAKLSKKNVTELFALLQKRDPRRAASMDTPSERNNKLRLIRALEIANSPQKTVAAASDFETLWIGVAPTANQLEQKIAKRLEVRIRRGLIGEAKRLHAQRLSYKRMEQLGLEYRSLARLLQKKISKQEFEEELSRDIRRYAKKQLMYWKRNNDIRWFDPKQTKAIERAVAAWLKIS